LSLTIINGLPHWRKPYPVPASPSPDSEQGVGNQENASREVVYDIKYVRNLRLSVGVSLTKSD
jgi:hypothetical protein